MGKMLGLAGAISVMLAGAAIWAQGQASEPAKLAGLAAAERGLAFASIHCASCHAMQDGISPEPEAPSFAQIGNRTGLTASTLRTWLRNSHNYPQMMNFAIAPEHIDELTTYILTLQDADYKPPIQ